MEQTSFEFLNYKIIKSVFIIEGPVSKNLEITFETSIEFDEENNAINTVETTIKDKDSNLLINIIMEGYFKISDDSKDDDRKTFYRKNTSMIMFPFLRSYIASLTSLSGVPPIILHLINISELD